jgi:hypothetical protein
VGVVATPEARGVIASWRSLVALAALAVVMAVFAATGGAPALETDRAIAHVDVAGIVRLTWSRPGSADVVVTRAASGWLVDGSLADRDTVDGVLTALRAGRWQRERSNDRASMPVASLHINDGDVVIGIAAPVADVDQRWIVEGDRALLVDGWVAAALAPEPLQLHLRHPLAGLGAGWTVAFGSADATRLDLATRAVTTAGATWRLDPARVDDLEHALAGIELLDLTSGPVAGSDVLDVVARRGGAAERRLAIVGDCPGHADRDAVTGSTGKGCITKAAADPVFGALEALQLAAIDTTVDRRPDADAATIQLADGTVVDRTHPSRLGSGAADPDAVAALFAALAAPAEVVATPTAPVRATLVATDATQAITRLEVRGDAIVRAGEPVALRPTATALAALLAPSSALRDRQLWVEEPTAITTLTLDGETLHRGAVVGEWDTAPARFAAIDLLAAAVAEPRALATADLPPDVAPAAMHHVAFTTAPPVGAAVHRELAVAVGGDGRCIARTDIARYVERSLCDAVVAATTSR